MSDDPYRIMMPPPPRWRRLVGLALGMLMGGGFGWASYHFTVAGRIPLWVPVATAATGGLIFGPLLFAFSHRWYVTGKGRYVPSLLIAVFAVFGRNFAAWLAGQPDSLSFFFTYFFALMAGFCLSGLLVSWRLRPYP